MMRVVTHIILYVCLQFFLHFTLLCYVMLVIKIIILLYTAHPRIRTDSFKMNNRIFNVLQQIIFYKKRNKIQETGMRNGVLMFV